MGGHSLVHRFLSLWAVCTGDVFRIDWYNGSISIDAEVGLDDEISALGMHNYNRLSKIVTCSPL